MQIKNALLVGMALVELSSQRRMMAASRFNWREEQSGAAKRNLNEDVRRRA